MLGFDDETAQGLAVYAAGLDPKNRASLTELARFAVLIALENPAAAVLRAVGEWPEDCRPSASEIAQAINWAQRASGGAGGPMDEKLQRVLGGELSAIDEDLLRDLTEHARDNTAEWARLSITPGASRLCAIIRARLKSEEEAAKKLAAAQKPPPVPAAQGGGGTPATEVELARALAAGPLANELRFVPAGPDAGWHRWVGSFWAEEPAKLPSALQSAAEALCFEWLQSRRIQPREFAQLCKAPTLHGLRTLLEGVPTMLIDPARIDPPYEIATPGGILDLRTLTTRAADPARDCFMRCTACDYDPAATSPHWDAISQHAEAQQFGHALQAYLGSALLGLGADRKLLALVGDGADGKSTLLRAVCLALGGFAGALRAEVLSGEARGAHGMELAAPVATARLCVSMETPAQLNWGMLKSLSGGDISRAKRLGKLSMETTPRAVLVLVSNAAPTAPDQAARDRLMIARWSRPEWPDPELMAILKADSPERRAALSACFRWLCEGAARFVEEGLPVPDYALPEVVHEGIAGWWAESVDLGRIIPGKGWTSAGDLIADAVAWARNRGADIPTPNAVGRFLGATLKRSPQGGTKGYKCTLNAR